MEPPQEMPAEEGPLPTLLQRRSIGAAALREVKPCALAAADAPAPADVELPDEAEAPRPAELHSEAESPLEGVAEEAAEATARDVAAEAEEADAEGERKRRAAENEAFWSKAKGALRDKDRLEKVAAFLKREGFPKDVNGRKGWWSFTFPLHSAARQGDVEMVRLLLESHAVRRQRDSQGRTARQVAKEVDFVGSHAEVIRILTRQRKGRKEKDTGLRRPAAAILGASSLPPAAEAAAAGEEEGVGAGAGAVDRPRDAAADAGRAEPAADAGHAEPAHVQIQFAGAVRSIADGEPEGL